MVIVTQLFTHAQTVTSEFIDHNNYMHDANYSITFSDTVSRFNYSRGLSLKERGSLAYTLFTLGEHATYLLGLSLGGVFTITLYIYDYDYKRLHLFLTLTKEDGTLTLTNEVMMMGVNQHTRRSNTFLESFSTRVAHYYKDQPTIIWPGQLGRKIVIPHKGALK